MWTIILSLILLCFNFEDKPIILLINDCKEWNNVDLKNLKEQFGITKDMKKFGFVGLGHMWIEPERKLSSIHMTFSEIQNSSPIYSSELSPEDWVNLSHGKEKVFIMKPNDFCSEKRFYFNHDFELLEVLITYSGEE